MPLGSTEKKCCPSSCLFAFNMCIENELCPAYCELNIVNFNYFFSYFNCLHNQRLKGCKFCGPNGFIILIPFQSFQLLDFCEPMQIDGPLGYAQEHTRLTLILINFNATSEGCCCLCSWRYAADATCHINNILYDYFSKLFMGPNSLLDWLAAHFVAPVK